MCREVKFGDHKSQNGVRFEQDTVPIDVSNTLKGMYEPLAGDIVRYENHLDEAEV
jgi:hypothetical protein